MNWDRLLNPWYDRASLFGRIDETSRWFSHDPDGMFVGEDVSKSKARHMVTKTQNKVVITVEVPGLTRSDLQIRLCDSIIRVVGQKGGDPHMIYVRKQFRVDPRVDVGDIHAKVEHGLLTLIVQRGGLVAPAEGEVVIR